ncbi:MAG: DUF5663 domain-containing protein [Syntrophobacteraceae bacterium]
MSQQIDSTPGTAQARSAPAKNPYIMNFCKVLVEKKGGEPEPEVLKKLLGDMYRLFECMLGQNMIEALPEDLKKEYLGLSEDLQKLSYEKIGNIFDAGVPQYQQVMKETMKQFADIFMKNKTFSPDQYPVPLKSD